MQKPDQSTIYRPVDQTNDWEAIQKRDEDIERFAQYALDGRL